MRLFDELARLQAGGPGSGRHPGAFDPTFAQSASDHSGKPSTAAASAKARSLSKDLLEK